MEFGDAAGDNFTSDFVQTNSHVYTDADQGVSVYVDNIPRVRGFEKAWSYGVRLDTGGRNFSGGTRQVTLDLSGAFLNGNVLLEQMVIEEDESHDVVLTIRAVEDGAFDDHAISGSEIVKFGRMAIGETRLAHIGWGSFYDADIVGLSPPDVPEGWCGNAGEGELILMADLRSYLGEPRLVATVERTTGTTWVVSSDGVASGQFARIGTEWSGCTGASSSSDGSMGIIPLTFELTITKP